MPSEQGKVALVTGGSSGIGLAIVKKLLTLGINVHISARDPNGHDKVKESLKDTTLTEENWDYLVGDVSNWESQVEVFNKAITRWGRIDYVFANGGIGEQLWLPNTPPKEGFVKPNLSTLDVDLTGALYTAALAIQQFQRQEKNDFGFRGKLLFTSSVFGIYGAVNFPLYAAAKHGIVGFTRSYRDIAARDSITVNSICPNITVTGISTPEFYKIVTDQGIATPMETLMDAFVGLLGDNKDNGSVIEVGPTGASAREQVAWLDDRAEASLKLLSDRSAPRFGL